MDEDAEEAGASGRQAGVGVVQATQQLEAAAEEWREVSRRSGGRRGGRGGLVLRELREGPARQLSGALHPIGVGHRGGERQRQRGGEDERQRRGS